METLFGGLTLEIPAGCFPLSTDSMLLADFVRLPRQARVLDLGSGCGTLGLLLLGRHPQCHVTGIELDPAAHQAALLNIERNKLADSMESICADITTIPFPAGSFDCCVSNPPYFTGGAASQKTPLARHASHCDGQALFSSAAKALRFGGDFFLVHKPENLAQLCFCGVSAGLEPKRLCMVRHQPDKSPALILLQCRKGGKPGLTLEELTLFNPDGSPTLEYRRIYHL